MFDLHRITLFNFRSYNGSHTFDFPTTDGLYYFTGRNLFEPELGANGAGKSTMLDAITWCLYGWTTRGLKANEVLSWFGGVSTHVVLELTVGKKRFTVKRSQKPNGIWIDDKPVDQRELETHLGLNYEAFTHSVISPQFGDPFFDKSPSDKLKLFSDIMKLDYWLTLSDLTGKIVTSLENDIAGFVRVIDQHEGKIEIAKADIEILELKEATFEADKQKQLATIKAESKATYKDVKKFEKMAEIQVDLEEGLKGELSDAKKDLVRYKAHVDFILESISSANREKDRALTTHETALSATKRMGFKGSCPHCGQEMDAAHATREKQRNEQTMAHCGKVIKDQQTAIEKHLRDLVRAKGNVAKTEEIIDEIKEEMRIWATKLERAQDAAKGAAAKFDELGERLHALEKSTNPHTEMLARKRTQLKAYKKIIAESTETLNGLEAEREGSVYWVKGFKRIRLFIIEQAFRTLEIEVNNCLAQLGMVDWQVTFDVERENKSGGITKGFVVMIKSPSNKEPVRWENWSGGETQRLQLAGDMGLSNLIMQGAGLSNTIEFYDEPSTHLSPEGMMDLADLLHERAVNEGKRIWIVDHASITNFGGFEGVITVEKTKNGSAIVHS